MSKCKQDSGHSPAHIWHALHKTIDHTDLNKDRETETLKVEQKKKKTLTLTTFPEIRWFTVALALAAHPIALTLVIGRARPLRETPDKGIALTPRWTSTAETAWRIGAHSGEATLAVLAVQKGTLIDVLTPFPRIARSAHWTVALVAAQHVGAQRPLTTLAVWAELAVALVDVLAIAERIAREAGRTMAMVAAHNVGAHRPLATQSRRSVAGITLVDVCLMVHWLVPFSLFEHQ